MAEAKHITEATRKSLLTSDFWKNVVEADGCWPWSGTLHEKGYGRFFVGRSEYRAHRVAFALSKNTALPGTVMVCHRCDNPACCNPNHLFLGLAEDNNADALEKGRHVTPRGEANGNGKLTDEAVSAIRFSSDTGKVIAKRFGVSQALVSMIRTGQRRMVGDTSFELVTLRV